tara:strand:+ start:50 stop:241 length:192 start_codon:yes stop_codon:yes gene_type:complete
MKNKWSEIASSRLWLLPAALLGILILIEFIHLDAHQKMEIDVHGHCKNNAEYQESKSFGDDDW